MESQQSRPTDFWNKDTLQTIGSYTKQTGELFKRGNLIWIQCWNWKAEKLQESNLSIKCYLCRRGLAMSWIILKHTLCSGKVLIYIFFYRKNTVNFHSFSTQKAVSYITNRRIAPYIEKWMGFFCLIECLRKGENRLNLVSCQELSK